MDNIWELTQFLLGQKGVPLEEAGLFIEVRNISSLLPKILEATISISSQDFLSLCFLYSVHSDRSFRIIALKKNLIKSQVFFSI